MALRDGAASPWEPFEAQASNPAQAQLQQAKTSAEVPRKRRRSVIRGPYHAEARCGGAGGMLKVLRMRCVFARLLVALAVLMVLPGSAWGSVHYLCRMSGRVQASCCCAKHEPATPIATAGVSAPDCCERLVPGETTKATSPRATVASIEPAALAAVVPVPLDVRPAAPSEHRTVERSRGPPGPRRPLFVVHCAYLC